MDHIQNDFVGLEPKHWDPTIRIKNVQKYCLVLIRYADENTVRGLQSSKANKTLIGNVLQQTKMALVEKDKNYLNKISKKFKYPELLLNQNSKL